MLLVEANRFISRVRCFSVIWISNHLFLSLLFISAHWMCVKISLCCLRSKIVLLEIVLLLPWIGGRRRDLHDWPKRRREWEREREKRENPSTFIKATHGNFIYSEADTRLVVLFLLFLKQMQISSDLCACFLCYCGEIRRNRVRWLCFFFPIKKHFHPILGLQYEIVVDTMFLYLMSNFMHSMPSRS